MPVIYRSQKNSWMNLELFQDWFDNHFVLEVQANLRNEGLPEDSKVLLLLDNCRAHPPSSELTKGNIFTLFLPPNVTSLIQPMDQGIIQNFKANYKSNFLRQLVLHEEGLQDFLSNFTIKDAIWCAAAA